ncbi:MAG: VWA domain-containing protein [Methanophagales archaeon ANME-1-THS]|nr:MAG: VWA domain-containing protein [Methanophagales archaeon ANME-1-THS]
MRTNNILMLAMLLGIFCAAIGLASGACEGGGVGVDATLSETVIEVNDTTTVKINLTGNGTSALLFPVDVVLAMDCSGSMERYGTLIVGTYDVTLTNWYQKVPNSDFTLSEVSDVETMFQIPVDVYYGKDKVSAYLRNRNTGSTTTQKTGYSTQQWSGVAAGNYEVYAKLVQADGTPGRTFAVELPPVRIVSAKTASKAFVDLVKENDQTGLVRFHSDGWSYNDHCQVKQVLTTNKELVKNNIDSLNTGGGTPMGEGLKVAINHLDSSYGRAGTEKAIIMLTDGWWNMGCDPMEQAQRAAEKGYTVYMIGWGGVNQTSLQQIADMTGGRAYFPATADDLVAIYEELAKELSAISATNVALRIELSDDVTYNGNASRAPDQIIGNTLIWNVGSLSAYQSELITFDVQPKAEGTWQVVTASSKVTYKNVCDEEKETAVPALSVKVVPKKIPPVAVFTTSDTTAMKNQTVTFNALGSYDPDGTVELYRWDFENDGVWDIEGNVLMVAHSYPTYPPGGTYTVKLQVVDNTGAIDEEMVLITMEDEEGGVKGNVTWTGRHSFEGLINRDIGYPRPISAEVSEISSYVDDEVDVTVDLYADGVLLKSVTEKLPGQEKDKVITVPTTTWVPMSSGLHLISLRVRAEPGAEWIGPTNDPTAGVRVYIEKVTT